MRHETQLVKCSTRGCSGHTGWGQLLAPCVWAGPQTLNSSAAWRGSSLLHRSAHKLAAQPSRRRVRGVKGLQKGQRSPQLGRRPPPAPPLLLRHQLHNLTVKKKEGHCNQTLAECVLGCLYSKRCCARLFLMRMRLDLNQPGAKCVHATAPPCPASLFPSPLTRGSACSQASLSRKARRVRLAMKSSGVSQYSLCTAAGEGSIWCPEG